MSVANAAKRTGVARQHTLTNTDTMDLWIRQDGMCYYSGIKMAHQPSTTFMASLERLDPTRGYVLDNTVLCIVELNDRTQWSVAKTIEFLSEIDLIHEESAIETELNELRVAPKRGGIHATHVYQVVITDGVELHQCKKCLTYKGMSEFRTNPQSPCKNCVNETRDRIRQKVQDLVSSARSRSKERASRITMGQRVGVSNFTLTFEEAATQLRKQRGRCAYSGVRLRYARFTDWTASLERIDSQGDYQAHNVVFVCKEFNVSERSAGRRTATNTGSQDGWDKPKVDQLIAALRIKHKRPTPP